MIRANVLQLKREIIRLKKEINIVRHELKEVEEPLIIERVAYKNLTVREKRLMREARSDLKNGKMHKFVTLEEAARQLGVK